MEPIRIRMGSATLPPNWGAVHIRRDYREGAYQIVEMTARCVDPRGNNSLVVTIPIPETGDVIVDFPVAPDCPQCPNELVCMLEN